jgi:hypothetical protein
MEKQDLAIIDTLQKFLSRFNCAFYSIEDPVKTLEEYFDLHSD